MLSSVIGIIGSHEVILVYEDILHVTRNDLLR